MLRQSCEDRDKTELSWILWMESPADTLAKNKMQQKTWAVCKNLSCQFIAEDVDQEALLER